MTHTSLLLLVAVLGTACVKEPVATELSSRGTVSVAKVPQGIRLVNNTDRGVAYAISNPNWLGLLAICNDPEPACVRLAAGDTIVVPFAEIHGYDSSTERVSVYWWHVSPDGEGHKASDPVEVVVPLR